MVARYDGGAAHPHSTTGGTMGYPVKPAGHPGMSLRAYAAISIMHGFAASPNLSKTASPEEISAHAVRWADALLAELRK